MTDYQYITSNPEVLGGSREEIVAKYPQLTGEAVEEAMRYAARFLENDVPPRINTILIDKC